MIYERNECQRCTRLAFCINLDKIHYCNACFETLSNDFETKEVMQKLLKTCGLLDIEKTWLE